MADLSKFQAKVCYTAAGFLIHENKALYIKHKKLGIWLVPGGHIDEDEMPHEAAEREFWEETGIKVKAVDPYIKVFDSKFAEYVPSPFTSNLHWISQENYHNRLKSSEPDKRYPSKIWKNGCEQHFGLVYLVEPVGSAEFKENIEETDGIGWFSLKEIEKLDTIDDIKYEARLAFEIANSVKP